MKKKAKIFLLILVVLMILSLVLGFWKSAADKTGEVLNVAGGTIMYWAKSVFFILLGGFLIYTGVAALAVPAIGVALILIGLFLIGYTIWPLFKSNNE